MVDNLPADKLKIGLEIISRRAPEQFSEAYEYINNGLVRKGEKPIKVDESQYPLPASRPSAPAPNTPTESPRETELDEKMVEVQSSVRSLLGKLDSLPRPLSYDQRIQQTTEEVAAVMEALRDVPPEATKLGEYLLDLPNEAHDLIRSKLLAAQGGLIKHPGGSLAGEWMGAQRLYQEAADPVKLLGELRELQQSGQSNPERQAVLERRLFHGLGLPDNALEQDYDKFKAILRAEFPVLGYEAGHDSADFLSHYHLPYTLHKQTVQLLGKLAQQGDEKFQEMVRNVVSSRTYPNFRTDWNQSSITAGFERSVIKSGENDGITIYYNQALNRAKLSFENLDGGFTHHIARLLQQRAKVQELQERVYNFQKELFEKAGIEAVQNANLPAKPLDGVYLREVGGVDPYENFVPDNTNIDGQPDSQEAINEVTQQLNSLAELLKDQTEYPAYRDPLFHQAFSIEKRLSSSLRLISPKAVGELTAKYPILVQGYVWDAWNQLTERHNIEPEKFGNYADAIYVAMTRGEGGSNTDNRGEQTSMYRLNGLLDRLEQGVTKVTEDGKEITRESTPKEVEMQINGVVRFLEEAQTQEERIEMFQAIIRRSPKIRVQVAASLDSRAKKFDTDGAKWEEDRAQGVVKRTYGAILDEFRHELYSLDKVIARAEDPNDPFASLSLPDKLYTLAYFRENPGATITPDQQAQAKRLEEEFVKHLVAERRNWSIEPSFIFENLSMDGVRLLDQLTKELEDVPSWKDEIEKRLNPTSSSEGEDPNNRDIDPTLLGLDRSLKALQDRGIVIYDISSTRTGVAGQSYNIDRIFDAIQELGGDKGVLARVVNGVIMADKDDTLVQSFMNRAKEKLTDEQYAALFEEMPTFSLNSGKRLKAFFPKPADVQGLEGLPDPTVPGVIDQVIEPDGSVSSVVASTTEVSPPAQGSEGEAGSVKLEERLAELKELANQEGKIDEVADRYRALMRAHAKAAPAAIEALTPLIEANPEHANLNRALGDAYMITGRFQKAIEAYNKAVAVQQPINPLDT